MKLSKLFSNRVIFVLATIVFVVWILFFDRNNFLDSLELDERIEKLEEEKAYYMEKIRQDSTVINGLKDSAYLERFTRENFYMQRENEEIYTIQEE